MPLTKKGEKMKKKFKHFYGKEKGEQVFYATENKGKIQGLVRTKHKAANRMAVAKYRSKNK